MPQPFARAHLIAGGFPPGQPAGHDHDYARLRLLELLGARDVHTSSSSDFVDVARWLPNTGLLITYVSGPFAGEEQAKAIQGWLADGGRWLALHGSSGGKAVKLDGGKRAMVKTSHHEVLGGFFLNHPPMRRFRVDVRDHHNPLMRDLPDSFEVVDELYQIEVADLATTDILLTTELAEVPLEGSFGFVYEKDTSVLEDGKTRVLGFTRPAGKGAVTYIALGHCHTPTTNSQPFVDKSIDPEGKTPLTLRGPWETDSYKTILRNAIDWGIGL